MSALSPSQILNLWRSYEQIRQTFKTLGNFQDYQLNPSASRYSVTTSHTGKLIVVENPTPQKKHKFL
jgi:hypothetical protein